jgi:hypothetical protein
MGSSKQLLIAASHASASGVRATHRHEAHRMGQSRVFRGRGKGTEGYSRHPSLDVVKEV